MKNPCYSSKTRFNKMLLGSVLGLCLLIPCQGGCAATESSAPPPPEKDRFAQMDVNGDGKIVIEEFTRSFPNMSENAFVVIDKNGDKGITREEWTTFMEGHAKGNMPGMRERGAPMNNIPGDPLIPPPDSNDLPLMRPPSE